MCNKIPEDNSGYKYHVCVPTSENKKLCGNIILEENHRAIQGPDIEFDNGVYLMLGDENIYIGETEEEATNKCSKFAQYFPLQLNIVNLNRLWFYPNLVDEGILPVYVYWIRI